jgi:hypothetical protein
LEAKRNLVRLFGLRDIAAGIATLSVDKQFGLWSRVAGDGFTVLTLLAALDAPPHQRSNAKMALLGAMGVTVLDLIAAKAVSEQSRSDDVPKDYSDRSGFPTGISAARNSAKEMRRASRA